MMFSDEEIKEEIPDSSFMRPGDEIISIREVCLSDKYDKKDLGFYSEPLLSNSGRHEGVSDSLANTETVNSDHQTEQLSLWSLTQETRKKIGCPIHLSRLDVSRSLFRDGFFPEGLEQQQARFAWTEEDGNIAALVSEPGFGTTGQTTFGKDLDAALSSEMKEADTSTAVFQSTNRNGLTFARKPFVEPHLVSSTSSGTSGPGLPTERGKTGQGICKVDKTDPRSRFHYVKYVKRHGRTVKLWECGICSREFQHQYTLMRHLPTHTDERNFHCDACGKSFRQLSTLSQHRAIHSAERPYACEVCSKTFNRVSTLISHRKTHSDEKPYKCHICPKGFHQKGNLRNHLFTHTNERPYRCNICLKGFNQQSNLVCHKNKAHPDEGFPNVIRQRSTPRPPSAAPPEPQPDSTRPPPVDQCEVTSSVGPYLPAMEVPAPSNWTPKPMPWEIPKPYPEPGDIWTNDGPWGSGVIVDPIKTYHMGVALATKQTPFALLKPDNGAPVLVKVVDTALPGGKQMLVPATAEDLRVGGKIVLKNEENAPPNGAVNVDQGPELGGAVQIRVPVVATVVPRIRAGGRLHLVVEEPHHAYHTALSSDVVNLDTCSRTEKQLPPLPPVIPRPESLRRVESCNYDDDIRPGGRISSSCALPPPAPSPPLDLIPMDLFEPMECIPMGPQITAVDNIDEPPNSDDSDIFIGEFEESIPLSDSD